MWAAINVIIFIAGSVLLYVSIFLYADEHGRLQDRIEKWWLDLEDWRTAADHRHVAFVLGATRLAKEAFDWMFGNDLFSVRAAAVSGALSMASVGVGASAALSIYLSAGIYGPYALPIPTSVGFPMALLACLAWTCLFGYLAFRSADSRKYQHIALVSTFSAFPIWFFFIWIWYWLFEPNPRGFGHTTAWLALRCVATISALLIGVASHVMFVAITRRALLSAARLNSWPQILGIMTVNLSLATVCALVPIYFFVGGTSILQWVAEGSLSNVIDKLASTEMEAWLQGPRSFFAAVAALNLSVALPAFAYFALMISLLLHRVVWRLVNRPLYAIGEMGMVQRRKMSGAVGLSLIVTVLPGARTWIQVALGLLS